MVEFNEGGSAGGGGRSFVWQQISGSQQGGKDEGGAAWGWRNGFLYSNRSLTLNMVEGMEEGTSQSHTFCMVEGMKSHSACGWGNGCSYSNRWK